MRGVLHVLATAVLVPYLVLAAGFVLLGHTIAGGSLLAFFDRLLMHFTWLVPWGIIGFGVVLFALATLGLFARFRVMAGLVLCLTASTSTIIILVLTSATVGLGEVLFLLPCLAVATFGAWLAVSERHGRARGSMEL
jgi:hypothetical protein